VTSASASKAKAVDEFSVAALSKKTTYCTERPSLPFSPESRLETW
jgi:hypothetical protein